MKYPSFWSYNSWQSTILYPISLVFCFITWVRRVLAKPVKFAAPVICVGNISVGGTGKTQVVAWLVQKMQSKKVVIICKGYKGSFTQSKIVADADSSDFIGDEPKILSKIANVIVTKNFQGVEDLVNNLAPDMIILDDFLQNPNVIKNVGIVVIDADRMFGNGKIIPAGPLRQNLQDAQINTSIFIAIGSSSNRPDELDDNVFFAQIIGSAKFDVTKKYVAFAGIGNPERFFKCLNGLNVIHKIEFDDHHQYTFSDIEKLKKISNDLQATLITTPKDAVKLQNLLQFQVFEPELKFLFEDQLINKIYVEIQKNKTFN